MLKRLGKILGRIVAAVILIVWIDIFTLWIRSYWRGDVVIHSQYHSTIPWPPPMARAFVALLMSGDGGACLAWREKLEFSNAFGDSQNIQRRVLHDPTYPQPSMWATSTSRRISPGNANQPIPTGSIVIKTPGGLVLITTPLFPEMMAPPSTPTSGFSRFVFYVTDNSRPGPPQTLDITHVAIVPYWSLQAAMSILALIPIVQIRNGWRRRRRVVEGFCATCGYDLRATPDRCPECGAISIDRAKTIA